MKPQPFQTPFATVRVYDQDIPLLLGPCVPHPDRGHLVVGSPLSPRSRTPEHLLPAVMLHVWWSTDRGLADIHGRPVQLVHVAGSCPDPREAEDEASIFTPFLAAAESSGLLPARDWLVMLPAGHRELALRAVGEYPFHPHHPCSCLAEAVEEAFTWDETPEGDEFWCAVFDALVARTELPPVPSPQLAP